MPHVLPDDCQLGNFSMKRRALSCELHDYIEIACLYEYRLKLTLKNEQTIKGKAKDIVTTAEKREYLIIEDGLEQRVELIQLAKMEVMTPNALFKEINF